MDITLIISKYIANTATENEKEMLLKWLKEKDENKTEFQKCFNLWLNSNALLTDPADVEKALLRLEAHIALHEDKQPVRIHIAHKNTNRRPAFGFYLVRIVASALLLFAAGYIGYILRSQQGQTEVITNRLLTGPDGKGKYILPDGSTVWLNANSILTYPELFTGKKRVVSLEGEALFEVTKDRKNPFFVHAGELTVEVLGTRFLVNNYPKKPKSETVLVEGSIQISGVNEDQINKLMPGQLITYNKEKKQTELSNVDTGDYTNWIHSKLVFDRTELSHVIKNLEKWYGVEIVVSSELSTHRHLSFTIRRESLDEVLKNMSMIIPIAYRREGDIVYLFKKTD